MLFKLCKWLWKYITKGSCLFITGHNFHYTRHEDGKNYSQCGVCGKERFRYADKMDHVKTKLTR